MRVAITEAVTDLHCESRTAALDVSDPVAAKAAVQLAVESFGRLDVVVNNAGYGNVSSIEDTDLADFRRQIETNLFGTIIVTKAAIPVMRQQRAGHIIQFSSVGGRIGAPGRAPTCGRPGLMNAGWMQIAGAVRHARMRQSTQCANTG